MGFILTGIGFGTLGALGLTRLLSGLLFGTEAIDPATFSAVAGIFAAAGLLASWLPARAAAHVDPVETLRNE